jgi:hypothetical protein
MIVTNAGMGRGLVWLGLVAAPCVLVAIELFHPAGFTAAPGMFAYLCRPEPYDPRFVALAYPGPHWWFLLHMIQTPCVVLVAIGLWTLLFRVDGADGVAAFALAWLARLAVLVFAVYYTVLDAVGGIGLGRSLLTVEALAAARTLTPDQLAGARLLLDTLWTDPWVGGVGSVVSETGSWAILLGAICAAASLALARAAPWPALVLLLGFGWELQVSHASPHGPIAFALLIASALWMLCAPRRRAGVAPPGPVALQNR